jgi:hypothetical protein
MLPSAQLKCPRSTLTEHNSTGDSREFLPMDN